MTKAGAKVWRIRGLVDALADELVAHRLLLGTEVARIAERVAA